MNYDELFEKDFREGREEEVLTNRSAKRFDVAFDLIRGLKVDDALDIGCADGLFTESLQGLARNVFGIDVSETALRMASERFPSGWFSVGNIIELPFSDSRFDLVSCLDIIYYLDEAGRKKAVEELARVLKPGGWLLISTSWPRFTKTRTGQPYIKPKELLRLLGHRFAFEKEATTSTLLNLGFMRSGVAMLLRSERD